MSRGVVCGRRQRSPYRSSRSAQAAKELRAGRESVTLIERGSSEVVRAGSYMTDIVDAVKRVTDIMLEIAAASDGQNRGIPSKVHGRLNG